MAKLPLRMDRFVESLDFDSRDDPERILGP